MARPVPLENLPVLDNSQTHLPDEETFRNGLIIPVHKPLNWTSFDVVKYIRNRIPVRKVGHAGTLDPLAEGLLILCCGRATRTVNEIQEKPKTYLAEVTLGSSTPSYDAASDSDATAAWEHVTPEEVERVLQREFRGEIMQIPPVYSALKKNGQRMYELARRGVEVNPDPRPGTLHESRLLEWIAPRFTLEIDCGKGFYVRSLAHNLGKSLGTLAHLSALKRTATGPFSLEQAWHPEDFSSWCKDG